MLPFKLNLPANQLASVKCFTDNTKTIFGLTYDELCAKYDVNISEAEYNSGKGFLPNSIYGNCYYRYWCASRVFSPFGMKVLHVQLFNKTA